MIGAAHDFPGVAIVVDMTAPGERLEADAQASRRRQRAEFAKIRRRAIDAAQRCGRDIAAHQQQVGAELLHQVEFPRGALEIPSALRLGGMPSKSRKGWNAEIFRPRSAQKRADVARRAVEGEKIGLEDFDRGEAGVRDGAQLFIERAAEGNRGDRMVGHFACSRGLRGSILRISVYAASPSSTPPRKSWATRGSFRTLSAVSKMRVRPSSSTSP